MKENFKKAENSELEYQYRKVHGIMGEHSFSIVLPKLYALEIGIGKGDSVKVTRDSKRIIIEKA
jgi:phosphate uptake regulator